MREDIKGLKATVDAIAKDQALASAGRDATTLRGPSISLVGARGLAIHIASSARLADAGYRTA